MHIVYWVASFPRGNSSNGQFKLSFRPVFV
uniref:Uncharacterized protein n=1 Tax=Anguilla anguilla TaxID=7936 RepID=A0A0E9V456_ANGAN